MNAYIAVKTKPRREPAILKGGATLTFDHTMRNHRIKGDLEALASDWATVCRDMRGALAATKLKHELDAA